MANKKSASKQFNELRRRAEKAAQQRSLDNLEFAALSNEETQGLIHELQVHQIELEMRVSDDGVGVPVNFDFKDSDTIGIKIIKALAEHQLGGTVELDRTNGTKFFIRFKERTPKGVA